MLCPFCGSEATKVIDSRPDDLGRVRRRRCIACRRPFSTVERISAEALMVQKRDGRLEPFSRSKLVRGIVKAASLTTLSPADVNAFIDRIVQKLQPGAPGFPIPSTEIGRLVLQELQDSRDVTDVARIRYALVFLGTTTRANISRGSGLRDFLSWLEEVYGPPVVGEPSETPWRVIKRDGRMEPFQLSKLQRSLGIALNRRGSEEQVHGLASHIADQVRQELSGQALVTSQQIASEVLKPLRVRDAMAYLRYASIAKRFHSIEDFWMDALAIIRDGPA
jgi:transcriptional repressor NrdR